VVLRRRTTGPRWVRAQELPERPRADASGQVVRVFESQDRLLELEDEGAFLGEVFAAVEEVRIEQAAALHGGRLVVSRTEVRLDAPLPMSGAADAGTLRLLQLCDGKRTFRQVVRELTGGGAEPTSAAVAAARRLVELGFLAPTGNARERRTGDGNRNAVGATTHAAPAGAGGRGGSPGAGGRPGPGGGEGAAA
jgi:hypothetical protein